MILVEFNLIFRYLDHHRNFGWVHAGCHDGSSLGLGDFLLDHGFIPVKYAHPVPKGYRFFPTVRGGFRESSTGVGGIFFWSYEYEMLHFARRLVSISFLGVQLLTLYFIAINHSFRSINLNDDPFEVQRSRTLTVDKQ